MFKLLRLAICGGELLSSADRAFMCENGELLYKLAKSHDIAHLIAYALTEQNILNGTNEFFEKFKKEQLLAIYRHEGLQHELEELRRTLEAAKIPFMPLKGSVIRKFYPEPWLRTSCDIDVLVHEKDLDRAVAQLTAEKWVVQGDKNYHDISLYSPTGVHLELHFNIKENIAGIDAILERVWEHSAPIADKQYGHEQTNEFLMFHLLAHMSYHFVVGGCGIRPLLDIWILQNCLSYDQHGLDELCAAAGLTRFHACVTDLIRVWFEGSAHTPITAKMEAFIINGGVYGNQTNYLTVQQAKKGGKLRYILSRIFMPYDTLKHRYPVLKRHKWLYPLMQVRRWFSALLGGRAKNMGRELKVNKNVSRAQVSETTDFLSEIGL